MVPKRHPPAYLAELVGTFLLVFFICAILVVQSPTGLGGRDFAVVGLLHAFVLMMLIQTLGGTSGGHFNPAVTAGLAAVRKIAPLDALVYVVMQVIGGVAGALVCKLVVDQPGSAVHYGAPAVSTLLKGKTFTGTLVELIGTFVLVWAIMGVAVNPRGARNWAGFVIGATLGFAVMTFGPMTGAGLNPARSFGPALVSGHFGGGGGRFLVVFVLGPLLGGVLAALAYRMLVLEPQDRIGERPIDKLA